jgi:hypothetical protein
VNTRLVIVLAATVAGIAACSSARAGDTPYGDHPEWNRLTLAVGQQASGIVTLAKESSAFDGTSYTVKWALFPYGPPLVAAASSGQIDIGDVGNVPPITGAAKRLGFKVVAAEEQVDQKTQSADSLLVAKDSTITTVRDLRGKKIAVPIGSSAHGFLLNAIHSAGLTRLRTILRTLADQGRTLLVSSHQLNEVEEIADRVVILNRGRLVTSGSIAELTAGTDRVVVRSPGADALRAAIPPPATVEQTGPDALVVRGATTAEVGHHAFVAGVELHELRGDRVDLEELFFSLTEGAA